MAEIGTTRLGMLLGSESDRNRLEQKEPIIEFQQ